MTPRNAPAEPSKVRGEERENACAKGRLAVGRIGPDDHLHTPCARPDQTDPASPQTVAMARDAAPAAQDDIVVTGVRRSLQNAQALKRDPDQIVDAVVPEDIGKLPDNNASEALARIPGVQVNRAAMKGRRPGSRSAQSDHHL